MPLRVASANAARLGAEVIVSCVDSLRPPRDVARWDMVVSNPPYVCLSERAAMEPNVLAYEPAEALFVPDDDPLRFYRAIADYASAALKPCGELFFEINPLLAAEMQAMLTAAGLGPAEMRRDRFGRERLLKVKK